MLPPIDDAGVSVTKVTFYGVRGSTPSPCPSNARYGGNTSSVTVSHGDHPPVLLDLGTGLRLFGLAHPEPIVSAAFVTHLHWDHVQGLPFCAAVLQPASQLTVYGPHPGSGTLRAAFSTLFEPPYFPITLDDLPAALEFVELDWDEVDVGPYRITSRPVPHVGPTLGYRVDVGGVAVAYIPDHQQPVGSNAIDERVRTLCDGADLLIHDSQYTPEEFARKADWGHCTVEYAIHIAARCGVPRLVLYHHDPAHSDDAIDAMLDRAQCLADATGVEVMAAREGLVLDL